VLSQEVILDLKCHHPTCRCITAVQASCDHAANDHLKLAEQLSGQVASLLPPLLRAPLGLQEYQRWELVRPLARLLLWLIPEHIPTAQPQRTQPDSHADHRSSDITAGMATAAASAIQHQSTSAALHDSGATPAGWNAHGSHDLAVSFITAVLTVSSLPCCSCKARLLTLLMHWITWFHKTGQL
jgi:hypothetical protein